MAGGLCLREGAAVWRSFLRQRREHSFEGSVRSCSRRRVFFLLFCCLRLGDVVATVYSSSSSRKPFFPFLSFSLSLGGAAELWAFRFLSFSSLRTRSSLTSCLRRATRRASRVLPISPRACGSLLSRSSRRRSRRRLLRSGCFCSFSFRSACRGAKSAGCPHERFLQRAAPWLFFRALAGVLLQPFLPFPLFSRMRSEG